ncbi:MAG: hypothetical protein DHS80DRAFT_20505, partial [Piptocephalis tieghemiana]
LQDTDHEEIARTIETWKVTDWDAGKASGDSRGKIMGPVVRLAGHEFQLVLLTLLDSHPDRLENASVFLEYHPPENAPPNWYACVEFTLLISNPNDPCIFQKNVTQHRYDNQNRGDWGFPDLAKKSDLTPPYNQGTRGILEDNSVVITLGLRLFNDPYGTLWRNMDQYDPRTETEHVGLRNQGATCYMNSLLQSLYCTNGLRRAVYAIPTDKEKPRASVVYALQRLFYQLQHSPRAVDTQELTASFGWDTNEAFMQHDVQEFNRVLQDNLEEKMKGTPAEGAIERLFRGQMRSFIRCINVDYESARVEPYYDIQLNVKGCATLEDSFSEYINVETLDGDNQYAAEGHGLQDARKGVIFESFPPVLHLQLKRFEYDMERDAMVKINDRHVFPSTIDLAPYLAEDSPNRRSGAPMEYELYGVLVHSGDLMSGHYFALIRPTPSSPWLKFDDERVTRVSDREVYDDNYGGEGSDLGSSGSGYSESGFRRGMSNRDIRSLIRRMTNAYMLVYVRKDSVPEVLKPVEDSEIPGHLVKRIEREMALSRQVEREREERSRCERLKLVTDEVCANSHGFDLKEHDPASSFSSSPIEISVSRDEDWSDVQEIIRKRLHLDTTKKNRLNLWLFVNRQNHTTRVDALLDNWYGEGAEEWDIGRVKQSVYAQREGRFYVETRILRPSPDDQRGLRKGEFLLFVKWYDPRSKTMHYTGSIRVMASARICDVLPAFRALLEEDRVRRNLPPPSSSSSSDRAMVIYEEIRPDWVERIKDPRITFHQAEIQVGDIICWQWEDDLLALREESKAKEDLKNEEEEEEEDGKEETEDLLCLPSVSDYFSWVQHRVKVHFRSRWASEEEEEEEEITLTLSQVMTYEQVASALARSLRAQQPLSLQELLGHSGRGGGDARGGIRRYGARGGLRSDTRSFTGKAMGSEIPEAVLFYEVMDVDRSILQTHQYLGVRWVGGPGGPRESAKYLPPTLQILIRKGDRASIREVGQAVASALDQQGKCGSRKPIRLYDAIDHRIARIYPPVIPKVEGKDKEGEKYFPVYHFSKEITHSHGIPFVFLFRKDEPFSQVRRRLQYRMGLTDAEMGKIRMAVVPHAALHPVPGTRASGGGSLVQYVEDEEKETPMTTGIWERGTALGLDHPAEGGGSWGRSTERSIRIFN